MPRLVCSALDSCLYGVVAVLAVDAVLRKIQTETAGISKDCYLLAEAVLDTVLTDTYGCEVGESLF